MQNLNENQKLAKEFIEANSKGDLSPQKLEDKVRKLSTFMEFVQSKGGYDTSDIIKSVDVIPIQSESHIITTAPDYTELRDEFRIYDAHTQSGVSLLLNGPKGIGKTLSIAKWASNKKLPFIEYDCSEGTKETNLLGRFTMDKNGSTPFKLGVIPTIIECANKHGEAVLVLEELNALTPAMQKVLNPLLDWRNGVFVEAVEKHYRLDKGCKIAIFATMNPSSYGGGNELNEDLASRFGIWVWKYPRTSDEKKAINSQGIPKDFVKGMFNLAKESRAMEKKGEVDYAISTRDLDAVFKLFRAYKEIKGIDVERMVLEIKVLGNYEVEDQRDSMKSRIESIFGRAVFAKEENEEEVDIA